MTKEADDIKNKEDKVLIGKGNKLMPLYFAKSGS